MFICGKMKPLRTHTENSKAKIMISYLSQCPHLCVKKQQHATVHKLQNVKISQVRKLTSVI